MRINPFNPINYEQLKNSINEACQKYLNGKGTGFFSGKEGVERVTAVKAKLATKLSENEAVKLMCDIFNPDVSSPNFKKLVLKQLVEDHVISLKAEGIENFSPEARALSIYNKFNELRKKSESEWLADDAKRRISHAASPNAINDSSEVNGCM